MVLSDTMWFNYCLISGGYVRTFTVRALFGPFQPFLGSNSTRNKQIRLPFTNRLSVTRLSTPITIIISLESRTVGDKNVLLSE